MTVDVPLKSISAAATEVATAADLAHLLRSLRRREARDRDGATLTYREIAARTGWSHAIIGEYLSGTALPPTDRFDVLVQLLGASASELRALATARDRVEEARRGTRVALSGPPDGSRDCVPRELPAPVSGFVGRQAQFDQLDQLATRDCADGQFGCLRCAVIGGRAGIGKTALAVHWAHRRINEFPDGQIYINMHGVGIGGPVSPDDALSRFLAALGVEPARMPAGLDERAARYRTLVAQRRMLVVIDGASWTEQVRPLLPGGGGCLVIVTSRASLTGLVATDGAERIDLDALSATDATTLLRSLLAGRVEATPEDIAAAVESCGRLPLAIRVAAQRALSAPPTSLADIVAGLTQPA